MCIRDRSISTNRLYIDGKEVSTGEALTLVYGIAESNTVKSALFNRAAARLSSTDTSDVSVRRSAFKGNVGNKGDEAHDAIGECITEGLSSSSHI